MFDDFILPFGIPDEFRGNVDDLGPPRIDADARVHPGMPAAGENDRQRGGIVRKDLLHAGEMRANASRRSPVSMSDVSRSSSNARFAARAELVVVPGLFGQALVGKGDGHIAGQPPRNFDVAGGVLVRLERHETEHADQAVAEPQGNPDR